MQLREIKDEGGSYLVMIFSLSKKEGTVTST